MSEIFHKSCYTSRSSGYKYRTYSTNTGDRKRRDTREDTVFDRKFKELSRVIATKIDREVDKTQRARDAIKTKFEKVDDKVNSLIELQTNVSGLRRDLRRAENTIADMVDRVIKLDVALTSEVYSLHSRKSPNRSRVPIVEEEIFSVTEHTV